ncbi:MAG: Chromosome partition protein Smc [Verrucomicrobia subdivision 3 bacterium]|nr:Chromosome partition protein Smc [Limisphaerales bacterium]
MPIVAVVMVLVSPLVGWLVKPIVGSAVSIFWVIVFIVYGRLSYRKAGEDAEVLNQRAEHYYFVGYIATITGLVCILFRLGRDTALLKEAPEDLLILGGVSVFCTIIGLIGMNFFRARAFEIEQEARRQDAERNTSQMQRIIEDIAKNFDSFSARMEALEATRMEEFSQLMNASELSQNLKQLVGDIQQLVGGIQAGNEGLRDLKEVSSTATRTVHQLSVELGDMSRKMGNMNKRIDRMTDNAEKVQLNWQKIAAQSERIQTLAERLESASNSLQDLGQYAQNANKQVTLLGDAVAETGKHTQTWQEQTVHAHKKIDDFLTAFDNMCHRLKTDADKEIGDFCTAFGNASHNLQKFVEIVADFIGKLSESEGKVAGFSESLDGAISLTDHSRGVIEVFKTNLTETAATLQESAGNLREQFSVLSQEVAETGKHTQTWQEQTVHAHKKIDDFLTAFDNMCHRLKTDADKEIGDFCTAFGNASHNLQKFVEIVADFIGKLSESEGKVAGFSESLDGAISLTDHSRGVIEVFKTNLTETAATLQESAGNLREQFSVLSQKVAETGKHTQTWQEETGKAQEETGKAHQEVARFCEKFNQACTELQQAADTVGRFTGRLSERLSNRNLSLEMGGKSVDDFSDRLQETCCKMNPLAQSLDEITAKLKEVSEVLEGLKKHANSKKSWWPFGNKG